jgi:hypothetical protein
MRIKSSRIGFCSDVASGFGKLGIQHAPKLVLLS